MKFSFIVSTVVILVSMVLYGVIHSLLASLWVKKRAKRRFGRYAEHGYRLAYNIFALISFLPVLALPAILPDQMLYTIQYPLILLTLAIQALALVALLTGVIQTGLWSFLGVEQLVNGERNQDSKLVIKGLYCYVRHPLYTAGMIFIWLLPVMSWNLLVLNFGLSLYFVIGAVVEERKLIKTYGGAYLEYQRRVPMLFPRYRRNC